MEIVTRFGSSVIVPAGKNVWIDDDFGEINHIEISAGSSATHIRKNASQLIGIVRGSYNLDLNISHGVNNVEIFLEGEGAQVTVKELLVADSGEEISSKNVITINASDCKVTQNCKIVSISSKVEWAGRLKISENANNTDASQLVKALPLKGGLVILNPILDILNRNVKVKHGAVILKDFGDAEKLFLRNRGISDDKVDDILLRGFISS